MVPIPPANPINPPPLVVEQAPADITIPAFTGQPQSKKSLVPVFFNILFFLFGIGGIGYGLYIQSTIQTTVPKSNNTPTIVSITQPAPTLQPSLTPQPLPSPASASASASTDETVLKETLCFSLSLPKKNDVGSENNCDISYRSYPDSNNPTVPVNLAVFLNNKDSKNSQDMADQWLQLEKNHGSEDTVIEKGPIQIDKINAYKIITEYPNKAVQTTHIFVYIPAKYEAYGYPITGFELLSASDTESRPIQQKELSRLLETWKWK